MTLGEKLKLYRDSHFLTQNEMCEFLGVKKMTYIQWEYNWQKPSPKNCRLLCEKLKISKEDLRKYIENM